MCIAFVSEWQLLRVLLMCLVVMLFRAYCIYIYRIARTKKYIHVPGVSPFLPMTAIWPRHATMHRRIAAALVVHVAAGTRAAAAADDGARASTPDTAPEHPASHHHAFRPTYRRDQWVAQHGQSGLCRVPCGSPPLEMANRLPAAGSWTQEEGPRRVDA